MQTYVTDIEVFNAALIRVGESPIGENDTSAEAMLYRGVYVGVVNALLDKHGWSFARKASVLTKQGTSGNTPLYVYVLPNDLVIAHRLTCGGVAIENYEIRSGKLLCDVDADDLTLHYSYIPAPRYWNADFTEAAVVRLMAVIKRALHDDSIEAERLERQAETLLLDALARDRYAQGLPQAAKRAPLADRWRGGVRA